MTYQSLLAIQSIAPRYRTDILFILMPPFMTSAIPVYFILAFLLTRIFLCFTFWHKNRRASPVGSPALLSYIGWNSKNRTALVHPAKAGGSPNRPYISRHNEKGVSLTGNPLQVSGRSTRIRTQIDGFGDRCSTIELYSYGAENEIRTRDLNLGKVALYH